MGRFSVDINEVSEVRALIPSNDYPIYITKGSAAAKETEKGKFIILNFVAIVKDEEAAKAVGQDEPRVFPSVMVRLEDDGSVKKSGNEQFRKFCNALEFTDLTVFEDGTEDCQTQDEFNAKMFNNLAEACVGSTLLAKIGTRLYNEETQQDVKSLAKFEG